MEWVAVTYALQDASFLHFSCICNGILPGFNAVKDLCLKYRLITRVGKFQGLFHFPLASEKGFLTCIFHGNLLCHCKYNGRRFITINVLMAVGKT